MSRGGHNRAYPRPDNGEYRLCGAPPCAFCRKRSYPTRRLAKRALRVLYPGSKGDDMHAYRCGDGGQGFHIGHRDQRFAPRDDDETEE